MKKSLDLFLESVSSSIPNVTSWWNGAEDRDISNLDGDVHDTDWTIDDYYIMVPPEEGGGEGGEGPPPPPNIRQPPGGGGEGPEGPEGGQDADPNDVGKIIEIGGYGAKKKYGIITKVRSGEVVVDEISADEAKKRGFLYIGRGK
jgi:hypothetical protein